MLREQRVQQFEGAGVRLVFSPRAFDERAQAPTLAPVLEQPKTPKRKVTVKDRLQEALGSDYDPAIGEVVAREVG